MIPIARPQMGEDEKQRVWEAMASGSLAQGPRVAELEERFAEFVGADAGAIAAALADEAFMHRDRRRPELFGDGRAAGRIVAALERQHAGMTGEPQPTPPEEETRP